MDRLDLFRDFRRGVAAPSDQAKRQASARLARAVDREQMLGRRVPRLVLEPSAYLALALAVVAGATATALFISTPWSNSPGFLARAQAALTPRAGMILHEKWEATTMSTDPACRVTHGRSEIWIDETPPFRYRALANDFPPLACSSGTAAELGGTLDTQETLMFVPPNTLSVSPWRVVQPVDPVTDLREAIDAGRAHHEGTTQLNGRTVERIRIDRPAACPVPGCSREPHYAYVDPETFYPVKEVGPGFQGGSVERLRIVVRYLTYEYLPRTAANLALTNIETQHPNATRP
jgi:hypothetical protein